MIKNGCVAYTCESDCEWCWKVFCLKNCLALIMISASTSENDLAEGSPERYFIGLNGLHT